MLQIIIKGEDGHKYPDAKLKTLKRLSCYCKDELLFGETKITPELFWFRIIFIDVFAELKDF